MTQPSYSILSALADIVGAAHVSASTAVREQHGRDQSSHAAHLPDVVVWPANTAEVSGIVRLANEHTIPIVGWGAGTSIEGNPIPIRGGIVVSFQRMNRVLAIHDTDFQVTVQPGILYKDMNKVLAQSGLFFPPDPGANASVGGMVANNAAGIRTVKYGATRDNVLALEVVLASGEVIRTGSRSVKQSAGYDLTHLFTGSEGTLGLITEVTLKLYPLPAHFSAVTAVFPTVRHAAEAVFGIIGSGLNPGALELLDEETVAILNDEGDFQLAPAPNLFMEFSGASETALAQELELVSEICHECGATQFESGMGLDARAQLWSARHALFESSIRHFPGHAWIVTDVAVPISRYPELVDFAAETFQELELVGTIVGHAGDGNLHTLVFFPEGSPTGIERANKHNDLIVQQALSLGGTSTGEHGVGIGKQKYMAQEHGTALAVMRTIKLALDPKGIMNPGKVLGLEEPVVGD